MSTRIVIASIAVIYSSVAFPQSDQDVLEEVAVECAASLDIATILTDVNLSKMVMTQDATWWRSLLLTLVNETEIDRRIEAAMQRYRAQWNDDKISWDQLLDVAQKCSEMKLSLETASE